MANQKIYVKMENDEVCMKFYEWAEQEGYTFGGEKPTSKPPSDLIAVLPGKALCYVNTYGRIAAPQITLTQHHLHGVLAPP